MRLYQEAKVHFNLGQYELAADKFAAAIKANSTIPGLYRNLGLTYRVMGKCDLALPTYRKYLQLQPEGKHVERVKKEIAECAAKIGERPENATTGNAHLLLRVSESGAQVTIGGIPRGAVTGAAIPLQKGRHVVQVYKSGFLPWSQVVEITEGEVAAVTVTLIRDPKVSLSPVDHALPRAAAAGTLQFKGLPRGVTVSVDNVSVFPDDDGVVRYAPGSCIVRVAKPGLTTWERQVSIRSKQTTIVFPSLQLTPQSRRLRRWAWVSLAAAAVLGAGGAAVGLVENRSFARTTSSDRSGSRQELDALENRRQGQALASNVLLGVAAAAAGIGIILFAVTPGEATAAPSGSGALVNVGR